MGEGQTDSRARNSTVIRKFPWKLGTRPGDFGLRERTSEHLLTRSDRIGSGLIQLLRIGATMMEESAPRDGEWIALFVRGRRRGFLTGNEFSASRS